jgi:hypothetical protein
MAIQVIGKDLATLQDIEAKYSAARVSIRPHSFLSWNSMAALSGLLTGVAANGALFSFRNISGNPVLIRRVGVGFITTTAFTAAQKLDFGLSVARAFSASDSGGTVIPFTGNIFKHRSTEATLGTVDCRISSTAALTAGTKTLDVIPPANTVPANIGIASGWSGAVGQTIVLSSNLLSHDPEDLPLVLGQNEGINVLNLTAMGAAGVGVLTVSMELVEVLSY